MNAKEIIKETAIELGFERAVIASLAPLEQEREYFLQWFSSGYAGSMSYLERDSYFRTSPQLLYPQALSVVMLFVNYYTEPPEDLGPEFGRVALYATGKDYHIVIPEKLEILRKTLETRLNSPLLSKHYTDNVSLYEQALAARHGLGFIGKNSMVIGPKLMGSYYFIAEFFCDLELNPDERYQGTCGNCFRCGEKCPTGAIQVHRDSNSADAATRLDSRLCISYLTIENKGPIPENLRQALGNWVFGCDICQNVCPYNQKPKQTTWKEFHPRSGAGHYLHLRDLLQIKNQKEFLARFGHTALSRPKRRGLLRNALVVLGNNRPENSEQAILDFALSEEDALLREHAYWALSQYDTPTAKQALKKLYHASRSPIM